MLLSNLNLLATATDGIAKLRELILTLAVQGKLVPQDASDEPASALLKKIRAEKDRLIAEGKIKRDKPLAEIAEEEKPFELPEGWEWVRLGTLTSISTGKLDANAAVAEGQYPFFTCSNTPLTIDKYSFDCSAVLLAGNGDFNLKRYSGKFDAYQRTYVIEPILLDLQFLYFTLSKYIGELTKNQRGSAIPYLKLGDITDPLMPLPPLAEQSRIVIRVEELMRLCDALQAKARLEATQHEQLVRTLLASLTAPTVPNATPQAQADVMQASWQRVATQFDLLLDRPEAVDALELTIFGLALRGLLTTTEATDVPASEALKRVTGRRKSVRANGRSGNPVFTGDDPFPLPPSWAWCSVEQVATVCLGGTPARQEPSYWNGSIPWVSSGEVANGRISQTREKITPAGLANSNAKVYPKNTVLIAMIGQGKTRGQSALLDIEACTNQNVAGLILEENAANPNYVFLWALYEYVRTRSGGRGGAQPALNGAIIRSLRLPLPPLAEQSRIVARVASLRALCADLRQRLSAARTQQALLAQVLVGEAGTIQT